MNLKTRKMLMQTESIFLAAALSGAALLYAPGAQAVGTPTISLTPPPGIGSFGGPSLFSSAPSVSAATPASGAVSTAAPAAGGAGAAVGVTAAKTASGMIPFGGTVVQVAPCTNGGWYTLIKPAGLSPVAQIWLPGTITFLHGPLFHPGQSILGMDIGPGGCFVGKFFTPGMIMAIVGTSL